MTALEQLNSYLRRLAWRLRIFAAFRGAAATAGVALLLTVFFVWIANAYNFAHSIVLPLRVGLFLAVAAAVAFAIMRPLSRLTQKRVTQIAERSAPGFEQRLLTISEADPTDPFTELVAEDALSIARANEPEQLKPSRWPASLLACGVAAAVLLAWMIASAPGYWGYGASLLWTGSARASRQPIYALDVQPGNKTIRRKTDQAITARIRGFSAHNIRLFARYGGATKWEQAAMQPNAGSSGYRLLFAGLADPVEYYVSADRVESKHFTINVKDLPVVKRVRVAVHFPSGLGLKDVVDDPGGDIRAVEGSQADVTVLTDRPLEHGLLVFDNGSTLPLRAQKGELPQAHLNIQKDGSYHVAVIDGGETIRISDDYFIEAKKDEAPSVRFAKPGHDPRVSPIQEVPVVVEASDDFGLANLQLHYSVNGGSEQTVPLLKSKGAKEAQGNTMLSFENFKVVPGDLVSFYASASDGKQTSRSDIQFAQAEAFDYKFSQSQQAGMGMSGGMGMNGQDNDISERQKQIIAATFNELRDTSASKGKAAETARFLSDLEDKLSQQATTLASRMSSREMDSNSQMAEFSRLMKESSGEMTSAVNELRPGKWHDALGPEQKALQSLLRAEALFRDIQVAFGQRGGGGGAGGAQRDLARMFDLELDTSKNQYETGQNPANGGSQEAQQKAIDDAFERLKILARRQQELAAQQKEQQAFEQRWQQEQLRREAEELRQQMQQLAQNQQGDQQSSDQDSQQQNSSSASSSSSRGSRQRATGQSGARGSQQQSEAQRQQRQALQQAMNSLQRAEEEMRKAVSDRDRAAEERAASELQQAQQMLNNALHQQAGNSVSDMAQRAQELADEQKRLSDEMKEMYGRNGNGRNQEGSTFAGGESDMPEMNDPNSMRYGYGFRRRLYQEPGHAATEQEKALAAQKEKLAQQIEQLERQMQRQADSIAGAQPDAASKLKRALSDAEQKELALRAQKDAEWMRQGYGDRNLNMEDSVTAGLQQLTRQLRDLEQQMRSRTGDGTSPQDAKASEALAGIRALREQLQRGEEQLSSSRDGQRGSDSPSGQQGQNGQQGQQPGAYGNGARYSPRGGGGIANPTDINEAIAQLYGLRSQIDPRDRALYGYVDGALWNLRHLTGAEAGLLDARISHDAAISLERLEMELSKRAAQQQAQGARTGAPENSPEKYRDAVAEYYKKLSQPK